MTTPKIIKDLEATTAKLPALIDGYSTRLAACFEEMKKLKKAGLIYATEHWREGKYLYLLYPTKGGTADRRREYVGKDPAKIEEAKAKIQRAKKYDELEAESKELEQRLYRGMQYLSDAIGHLSRKAQW